MSQNAQYAFVILFLLSACLNIGLTFRGSHWKWLAGLRAKQHEWAEENAARWQGAFYDKKAECAALRAGAQKVGCKNFKFKAGGFCANCGFLENEH